MRSWSIVILCCLIVASCNSISNPEGIYKDLKSALKNKKTALQLSITNQKSIDSDIQYLTNLKNLSTSDNDFDEIPKEIKFLKNLEWLSVWEFDVRETNTTHSIGNNNRKDIYLPDEIGYLKNLKRLAVSPAKNIPNSIVGLTNLEILNIYGYNISEIPIEIGQLQNLTHLSIWGSYKSIPESIGKLKKLTNLTLVGGFSEIPESISQCEELKELTIGSEYVSSIPLSILQKNDLHIHIVGHSFNAEKNLKTNFNLIIPHDYQLNCRSIGIDNFKTLKFHYYSKKTSQIRTLRISRSNIDQSLGNIIDFSNKHAEQLELLNLPKLSDMQKKILLSNIQSKSLEIRSEDLLFRP